ncbi:hypothetical protein ACOMHN_024486 [Nucella lapillus]
MPLFRTPAIVLTCMWENYLSKRVVGVGVLGRFFGRRLQTKAFSKNVRAQMDDLDDHRPYFTYWVTFVHILVFVVATYVYGLAPFGIGKATERKTADLIHLGARYSPCMRVDPNLKVLLNNDKKLENKSACCVRNDGAGCVQRVEQQCICTDTRRPNISKSGAQDRHMSCELLGHPCCFGIKGECWITTRDHCDLIRGRFHNDKYLCSQGQVPQRQVPLLSGKHRSIVIYSLHLIRGRFHSDKYLCSQTVCFQQICGMIPFSKENRPDQVYRLWTSIFLHAGLLHLLVTLVFQMWIMRDIEKLTGALRLSIIYIGSGIAANLASCTFNPYLVDAGPSGSQFGVVACLMVEVLQSFQMYSNAHVAILKMALLSLTLFIFGLLPWFDNWSHIFGFIFGFFLAFALIPYVSFGKFDRRRKIMTIIICLGITIGGFFVLILIFYIAPLTECKMCKYFNCIPFTEDFCQNMDISLSNRSNYDSLYG